MDITIGIFFFIILILSAIIHEYSHGWMAERLGDPTAKLAGRLTLNPISHIDPIGTILVPLVLVLMGSGFLFGWAKPVPFNPLLLKDKRWGPAFVALAGPGSNLLLAAVIALIIRLVGGINPFTVLMTLIVYVNVLLAVFNLVPLPPLDGSKILYAILPDNTTWLKFKINMERYGMFLVILFILYAWELISPIILFLVEFFVGKEFLLAVFS